MNALLERLAARACIQIEQLDHLAIDHLTFDLGTMTVDSLDGTLNIGITANALGRVTYGGEQPDGSVQQAEEAPPLQRLWPPPTDLKGVSDPDATPPAGAPSDDHTAG